MRDVTLVIKEMKDLSDALAERIKEIIDRPVGFSVIVHENEELREEPDKAFEKQLMLLDMTSKFVKNNMELKSLLMMLGARYDRIKD